MRVSLGHLLLAAHLWLLGGCGAPDAEDVSQLESRILDGLRSDSDEDSVVFLTTGRGNCSASLVAPNLVLTARHCLSPGSDGDYSCDVYGDLHSTVPGAGEVGAPVEPSQIRILTGPTPKPLEEASALGLEIVALPTTVVCRNDIAFVVLDRSLALPILPLRLGKGTAPNELLRIIGYGSSGNPDTSRYGRSGIPVTALGTSDYWTQVPTAPPRTIGTGRVACHGDSGGPALSEETGAIIGVFSLIVGGECENPDVKNFFTQVAAFQDLVDTAFRKAGATPWLEGEAAPGSGGASGTGGQPGVGGSAGSGGNAAGASGVEGEMPPGVGGQSPTGGVAGKGSSGVEEPISRLRPNEGCRCGMVGASAPFQMPLLVWLGVSLMGIGARTGRLRVGRRRRKI